MKDAAVINRRLSKCLTQFDGKQPTSAIAQQLQHSLRHYGVRVNPICSLEMPTGTFSVGGSFDIERKRQSIELDLFFRTKTFKWDDHNKQEFKFLVSQVLQHELIHRYQHTSRPDNYQSILYFSIESNRHGDQKELDYLSEFDEIEAYAHDIALEICRYYKEDPYEVLKTINRRRKIQTWTMYKRAFKNCEDWSPVRNKLLGKVYRWIPYIEF